MKRRKFGEGASGINWFVLGLAFTLLVIGVSVAPALANLVLRLLP